MAEWNWLDVILVTVVVLSVITAAVKGFVRELIALAAVLAGSTVAAIGYRRVGSCFEDLTSSHEVALGAGFLALFFGTLLVGALVAVLARRLIQKGQLQRADLLLGAVFGVIRGLAVDCVLLLALVAFVIKPDAVQQSVLAPYIVTGARVIALVMPSDLKEQFRTGFGRLRQTVITGEKKRAND